jgi:hypothetical protein
VRAVILSAALRAISSPTAVSVGLVAAERTDTPEWRDVMKMTTDG